MSWHLSSSCEGKHAYLTHAEAEQAVRHKDRAKPHSKRPPRRGGMTIYVCTLCTAGRVYHVGSVDRDRRLAGRDGR